jgi:hypothetical protein
VIIRRLQHCRETFAHEKAILHSIFEDVTFPAIGFVFLSRNYKPRDVYGRFQITVFILWMTIHVKYVCRQFPPFLARPEELLSVLEELGKPAKYQWPNFSSQIQRMKWHRKISYYQVLESTFQEQEQNVICQSLSQKQTLRFAPERQFLSIPILPSSLPISPSWFFPIPLP